MAQLVLPIAVSNHRIHGAVVGERVATVNDLLDGHVALDIRCLDPVFLNAYVRHEAPFYRVGEGAHPRSFAAGR